MSILKIINLHKIFKTKAEDLCILEGVNLEIKAGERIAIVGQSGSGKSTFLQIAGLLDSATSGDVMVDGVSCLNMKDREKTNIRAQTFGFVYQNNHLLREFTALENVLMPAHIQGSLKAEHKERAKHLLQLVGLSKRMHHFPSEMSGGEQQRVAIARALMNKPKLLLADEPTGNLDPQTATEVATLFKQLVKEEKMALLLVTHNEALAQSCDKTYHMKNGVLSEA